MSIPDSIAAAVTGLLRPYGVDAAELLAPGTAGPRFLTTKAAAAYCGLSEKYIRELVLSGKIEGKRLGPARQNRVLIVKRSLDNWLSNLERANR